MSSFEAGAGVAGSFHVSNDSNQFHVIHRTVPSIQEQLGADPISKLADAIERLCNVLSDKTS